MTTKSITVTWSTAINIATAGFFFGLGIAGAQFVVDVLVRAVDIAIAAGG